ncbi:MAG: rhomboid family intramembrane serine protease [Actinomycetota bacterium]|nr:rhomboid family intramembrane serine protease [Actinomycetota bacterium]
MTSDPTGASAADASLTPTCYRHADRETGIRCTRCERPICPECMVSASVGFQCPDCVREGNRGRREWRTQFGGRTSEDPAYVTRVLVIVNVVAFVLQLVVGRRFTDALYLIGFAATGADPIGVADGEVYRLLSAAFLHSTSGLVLHLGMNMLWLWTLGPQIERLFGRVRFLAVYLVAALGGNVLSYAVSAPNQPSLGASGAVFGLFGAALVMHRRLGMEIRNGFVFVVIMLGVGLLQPRVNVWAHFGGLVAGAAAAAVIAYAPRQRRSVYQAAGCVVLVAGLVAAVAWRSSQLLG